MIQKSIMTAEHTLLTQSLHLSYVAFSLHLMLLLCQLRKIIMNCQSVSSRKIGLCLIWVFLFLNPITISQITEHSLTVIQMQILFYYLFFQLDFRSIETHNNFIGIVVELFIIVIGQHFGVIVLASNCFIIAEVFRNKQRTKQQLEFIKNTGTKCILYAILLYVVCCLQNYYFPRHFQIGINMIGLLLSHTFTRYIFLNEIILSLCPYLSILPLIFVPSSPRFKVTLCYFFTVYCHCQLSFENEVFPLIGLFLLQSSSFPPIINEFQQKINKESEPHSIILREASVSNVVFYGAMIVSIAGYFIFRHFHWLYENTHIAGVSYLMVGQLVFWIAQAILLSETLMIEQYIYKEEKEEENWKDWLIHKMKTM